MRILITGISGAIGSALAKKLTTDPDIDHLVGIDIKPPEPSIAIYEFYNLHVASPELEGISKKHNIDVLVHLAWMMHQTHDEKEEHRTNILGSKNVLDTAYEAKIKHLIVASSGKVYGMHSSNGHIFHEEEPLNENNQLTYVKNKIFLEQICEDFEQHNPETRVTILRPCTIFGHNVDNPITRKMKRRSIVSLKEYNPERQFVDIRRRS